MGFFLIFTFVRYRRQHIRVRNHCFASLLFLEHLRNRNLDFLPSTISCIHAALHLPARSSFDPPAANPSLFLADGSSQVVRHPFQWALGTGHKTSRAKTVWPTIKRSGPVCARVLDCSTRPGGIAACPAGSFQLRHHHYGRLALCRVLFAFRSDGARGGNFQQGMQQLHPAGYYNPAPARTQGPIF